MAARFQDELGKAIRDVAGVWSFHPQDGKMNWRPGDWIFGTQNTWGVIEAKQVPGNTFTLGKWTPQQRAACRDVVNHGGRYWLVVNFKRTPAARVHDTVTRLYFGVAAAAFMEGGDSLDWRRARDNEVRYEPGHGWLLPGMMWL